MMFWYVPGGVLAEVRTINVIAAERFDGTKTDGSAHHAVAPRIRDQCSASGTTLPSKPATLVNVTLNFTVCPLAAFWLTGLATTLKSPSPAYEMVVEAPVAPSCKTSWKVPSCCRKNGPSVYLPLLSAFIENVWTVPSGKVEVSLTVAPPLAVPVMVTVVTPVIGSTGEIAATIPVLFSA